MVSFQVKELRDATESQIQEIADFFTKAFYAAQDIAVKATIGGDWSLLHEMEVAMLRATLLEGLVSIVTIGEGTDEKIVSAGYWFAKGRAIFGSEEQRKLGYNAFFEKLSDETKVYMTEIYPSELAKLVDSHYTKEESTKWCWCYNLATHPDHQGKGYATAIVDTMFEKAKAEGTFIGLATASKENVNKYHSMGFKSRGKGGRMPAPTGDFWVYFFTKGSLA